MMLNDVQIAFLIGMCFGGICVIMGYLYAGYRKKIDEYLDRDVKEGNA